MAVSLRVEVPSRVHPGETFRVVVIASTPEERACPSITFVLRGNADLAGGEVEICRQRATERPGKLDAGDARFEVDFATPPDAPPTFRHARGAARYVVSATVELPWSRDVEAHAELRVEVAAPNDVGTETVKERARRRDGKSTGKRSADVELARDATIGGVLLGKLELRGTKDTIRGVTAWIHGVDEYGNVAEATKYTPVVAPEAIAYGPPFPLFAGPLGEGAFTLALAVPEPSTSGGHGPSFEAKVTSLRHQVIVWIDRGQLEGLRAILPIRVHAPTATSREEAVRARDQRLRRTRVTALEAAKAAVDLAKTEVTSNEEATRLDLVRGPARTRVTEEQGDGVGPRLRAVLRWPSLGVGLKIVDAANAKFDGVVVDRDLADRCRVAARDETQLRHVVSAALARTLGAFERVDLHDRGGVVEAVGSLRSIERVAAIVARCESLHRSIRVRRKDIPLLGSVAAHEGAFAAFAARRRATLAPGDLSIDLAERGGIGWSLRFRFAGEAPVGIDVLSDNDTGLELVADATNQARAKLGQAVEKAGRNLRMSLPLTTDPASVESLLDAFLDLTRTLVRGGQRSPYR